MLAASASGVLAVTILPAATYSTTCVSGQLGAENGAPSCSQADGNGQDNVTVTFSPFAGLSADASVAGGVIDSFGTIATLHYWFEVAGGNPGDQIPLLVYANLFTHVSSGGDGYAFSEVLVATSPISYQGVDTCTDTSGRCPATVGSDFSGDFGVTVTSGQTYEIVLEIEATASPVLAAGESASASADPLIVVAPSFPGAAGYAILLSPGIANATSSVPEPGSLTLLIGCCPLALFARRRFRRA
jgi:hypothetical protein